MNKAKAITNDIASNSHTQKFLFRLFISLLVILFAVYIYLIGSITFNVLARKNLEGTVKTLGTSVSQLELTYLSRANEINKNYVLSLGYIDREPDIFVTRSINHVAIR